MNMTGNNREREKARASQIIIGIGNEYRGDDGVGLYIARKIREMKLEGAEVIEAHGEGTGLIDLWKGADLAIVADAVSSGGIAGTIYRFEVGVDEIPAAIFDGHSSHAFGLAEAIKLSETLGMQPRTMILYGIEGSSFNSGDGLSPEIRQKADEVISRIIDDIKQNPD